MLGNMGCVISMEEKNIDSIHTKTYRAAQLELPAKDFVTLTQLNEYRQKNFSDASFFHTRLKLYWIKPLYVFFVFILYRAGIPLVMATLIPSLASLLCMGLLFFFWLRKYLSPPYATIIASLIMLSPPFWVAARYSTADAFAALFVFSAFYFMIGKKKSIVALVLMLVATLVRLDLALLAIMMIAFMMIPINQEGQISRVTAYTYSALVMVMAATISFFTGNFGANAIEYYNWGDATSNTAENYFRKLAEILLQLRYSHVTIFIAIAFMGFMAHSLQNWKTNRDVWIVLLLLLYIIFHYLLYPGLDDRFFIAEYLILSVIGVKYFVSANVHVLQ